MPNWTQKIKHTATDWLSLPPDALLKSHRVTCVDGTEVIVEHLRKLLHVSVDEVLCDLGDRRLRIIGESFEVLLVTESELHLRGHVTRLEYVRSETP
ncbi:MAG: YabP/YqfC family sporulation protein [Alicyclobacillaceae bacterium]|uniref:YabP/YqfC family sporulation protein n=1 Tax=Alicyclobacillus sp. SP_1 TaxID=2942475 RepID=UPI002157B1B5|nr:YabP/YqfC family sporulation protein [Alicyclobacillus sp. SP_1]MCY0888468.1 YabP/YqfC family sporulation protein [Alicyclobacillaceae bacterium]MCY0895190.1 YabP/YqfC family sporulation protein [Alicyclobacillaceae bacterium]